MRLFDQVTQRDYDLEHKFLSSDPVMIGTQQGVDIRVNEATLKKFLENYLATYPDNPKKEVLMTMRVDRFHTQLVRTPRKREISIVDLNSRCGTYVNSRRLKPYKLTRLRNNDIVSLGQVYTFGFFQSPNAED